ncbi:hypothetical protein [Herbaspirillum sp. 1130]|uniref:hypothetical protein n=1 Tax=Herbaspirillum sp. 1130 TaxID=2806562 RepID=UPI001AE8C399|nr:hypothetical protein [Herbaspirillum sp. 1130]MBP1316640.1 hypothetical protein [Herbaspirillum sp. 1130]
MKLYSNSRFNSDEVAQAVEEHRRLHGDCYFENNELSDPLALNRKAMSFRNKRLMWGRVGSVKRRATLAVKGGGGEK